MSETLRFRPVSTRHLRDRGVRWLAGPGLFCALLLLTPGLRAESEAEVGLAAQGVDPQAAIDNKLGLDVRDELGRPVTSRQVMKDLKAVTVERAATTAYASRLHRARQILPALENLAKAAAAFALAIPAIPLRELLPGLPAGGPKAPRALLTLFCMAAAATAFCCRLAAPLTALRSRQSSPLPLRC